LRSLGKNAAFVVGMTRKNQEKVAATDETLIFTDEGSGDSFWFMLLKLVRVAMKWSVCSTDTFLIRV
jgi:hypothetical protein